MRTQLFYSALAFSFGSLAVALFTHDWLMGASFVASLATVTLLAYLKKDPKPIDETQGKEIEEIKKRIASLELRTGFTAQNKMRM